MKSVSKSDEENCTSWEPTFSDRHLDERGLAVATRIMGDPFEAEDMLQEARLRLWIHGHAEETDNKPGYFLASVRNKSRSWVRKRSRSILVNAVSTDRLVTEESQEAPMQIMDPGFNPEMNAERNETNKRLSGIFEACCEDITDYEKDLLRRHLNEESNEEIAHAYEKSVEKIRVDFNRIMNKIRYRCKQANRKFGGQ